MSHEINFVNGKASVFTSRQPAWHKLGVTTPDTQTWVNAMRLANLNWEVEKHQFKNPLTGDLCDAWGTFRADTKEFLGQVGQNYIPIQNAQIGQVMDTIVNSENGAHYDSAGALGHGERVWGLIDLNCVSHVVSGDPWQHYLVGMNSHDGSQANRYFFTSVRVVCANTWRMADSAQANRADYRIRHTGEISEKLEIAKAIMKEAKGSIDELNKKLKALVNYHISQEQMNSIIKQLFPKLLERNDDGKKKGEFTVTASRQQNQARDIIVRFEHNDGDVVPKIRGTAYNLFNAVTEHVDHCSVQGIRQGRYVTREQATAAHAVLYKGDDLKHNALDVILSAIQTPEESDRSKLITSILDKVNV